MIISASRVILPGRIEQNTEVVVEGGRIVAVQPATKPPAHYLLAPGLIDLQVNGHDDVDVATMSSQDMARMNGLLLAQGVTSWYPTLVTTTMEVYAERFEFFSGLADEQQRIGPQICGVHLEGPYLGERHGAHRGVPSGPIDIDWLRALPDIVRIVTPGPERPNAVEAIKVLAAKGIVVSLGHTGATFEQSIDALDAGAQMLTHCFNAMVPLHHRDPGPIGACLTRDDVAVSLIADDVHVHPAAAQLVWRAKPAGKVMLITDAVAWRTGRLGSESIDLVDGAPRLSDGTLAGSSLTLSRAVRNAVDSHGVSCLAALSAATRNPAHLMGLHDRGNIDVGARADITVFDESLKLVTTFVAGELVGESSGRSENATR